MSKSNSWETGLLTLLFNNTNFANVGDATGLRGSTTAGSLYISLHTADPGEAGTQSTSEATYTNYVRVAVARTAGGWTISGNQASNAALIAFAQCGATGNTITHWGLGTDSSGAGTLLYSNTLGASNQGPFTAKTNDTITIPGHTLVVNDRVAFYAAFGSSLPTGMTEGTQYFVITVSGDDITVSTTQGGGALDLTTVGDGVAYKASALAVSNGITPQFAISALIVQED